MVLGLVPIPVALGLRNLNGFLFKSCQEVQLILGLIKPIAVVPWLGDVSWMLLHSYRVTAKNIDFAPMGGETRRVKC